MASVLAACLAAAPALGQTARPTRPAFRGEIPSLSFPTPSAPDISDRPLETAAPIGLPGDAGLPSLPPQARPPAAAERVEPVKAVQDEAQTPAVGSPEFQGRLESFQERALEAQTQPAGGGARAWTALRESYDGGARGLAVVALPAAAAVAASPWLYQHADLAALIGSGALTFVGMPQIVKNFRYGREATKDVSLSWPLIWFAVGVLLSVVSLANGSNFWWNASNLAAVGQSVVMTAQINAYNRDRAGWKRSLWTAGLVLAPLPLVFGGILLPTAVWVRFAFAAAVALLLVIGWPQIRMNHLLYESERRGPDGIALLKPLLLLLGGIFNLTAAAAAKDLFWALNNAISLAATLTLAAQMFFPKAANASLGPLLRRVIRAEDKILAAWKGR